MDGKREEKLRKRFEDQSDERKRIFFLNKALVTKCQRESYVRDGGEVDWDSSGREEGENVGDVRGVGGEDVPDIQ